MMSAVANLTAKERLLLMILKPARRAHPMWSSLLRGRNEQFANEYTYESQLLSDLDEYIEVIRSSNYPLRRPWLKSIEVSKRAITSRYNVGRQRAIRRNKDSTSITNMVIEPFLPRGGCSSTCEHGKERFRCKDCKG